MLNKDAADRPTDADQLITVLEHVREAIISGAAGQHTASMAAVAAAGAAAGAGAVIAGSALRSDPATNGSGELAAVPVADEHHGRGWVPWAWAALVVLLVAGAAAAAYFLTRTRQYVVPDVRGEQVAVARKVVQAAHFQVGTIRQASRQAAGTVIGEIPGAGSKADKGSTVTLTVSSGRGDVSVPPVQGLSQAAATRSLKRVGLKVADVVPQSSTRFAAGQVTDTSPGVSRQVRPGSGVILFVSSGPPQQSVPDVTGETQTQATADLTRAGFNVAQRTQPSSTVTVGNVIGQTPGGGSTAAKGATVTITVASAPSTVKVPSVTGDQVSGAVSALTSAGFNVSQTSKKVTDPAQNGIVVQQSPGASSTANKGSTVTITVGHYTPSSSSSTTSSSTTKSSSSTTSTTSSSPTTSSAVP